MHKFNSFTIFPTTGAGLSIFPEQAMDQIAPNMMTGVGYSAVSLEFEVKAVDEEYRRLNQMGIPVIKPPTTQPWGIRSAWFRDPQ